MVTSVARAEIVLPKGLSVGAGEYVVAVGDVVSGLVTLAFLPRSI